MAINDAVPPGLISDKLHEGTYRTKKDNLI